MADPAALAADAEAYETKHRSGPPRKRDDASRRAYDRQFSRVYRTSHPGRRRVLSAASRLKRNARMREYLKLWRRRTGRLVSPHVVRLRWARVPDEAVFHLLPTLGKLSRKPPTPTHPICAPHLRLTRLVCPFRNREPLLRCRDCEARRTAWEQMVSRPMPEPQPMRQSTPSRPQSSAIDAHPRLRETLRWVTFPIDGLSPPAPG